MANTQAYLAVIDQWQGHVAEDLITVARRSIFDLTLGVITYTPVLTGFLRGGWQPSINAPPPLKEGAADPQADAFAALQGLEIGDTFYFTNSVIYARRVEYGFVGLDSLGRYYNQAGRFYMTNNLARWQSIVDAQAHATLGGLG